MKRLEAYVAVDLTARASNLRVVPAADNTTASAASSGRCPLESRRPTTTVFHAIARKITS
jgi:hypothetical protein